MKKTLFSFSFVLITASCSNVVNNTNIDLATISTSTEQENRDSSPMEKSISSQIAKLFDRNKDGIIEAKEFKISASIWTLNSGKVIEKYENWDYIKKIPLQPIPVDSISRALSLEKGDGYLYFGTIKNDYDVSDSDYSRISEGISNLMNQDNLTKSQKIPVGAFRETYNGSKTVTELVSSNTLRKAVVKQFRYSPDTQIELSNKLHYNNDGYEKKAHRIGRINYDYLGWFE